MSNRQPARLDKGALQAFRKLKTAFTEAPVLAHYHLKRSRQPETDLLKKAIAGILFQLVPDNPKTCLSQKQEPTTSHNWHPIAFYLQQMTPAKQEYAMHEQEMLAIVMSCRHWRHYLEGALKSTQVLTDHQALTNFFTTKPLTGRKVRWWETLVSCPLDIIHRPGKTNTADAPSRRPDYISTDKTIAREPQVEHIVPPDPTGIELGIATTLTALLNGILLASSLTMHCKVLATALGYISQNKVSKHFKDTVVRLQANNPLAKQI